MILKSVFKDMTNIPSKYTCDGINVNPPLEISEVPKNTKSIVLIIEDPDSVGKANWVHWIVWNISPHIDKIGENSVPDGAVQGKNDAGENKYSGPCPPLGSHRYYFKLYALDCLVDLPEGSTRDELRNAINGHILQEALITGLYSRKK